MMRRTLIAATSAATVLAGCSMEPAYVRPEAPVPPSWPAGDTYLRQSEAALPSVTYAQVFTDPRLQRLIATALANNRDVRIALANIQAARAQYRIQRSDLLPQVDTGAGYRYSGNGGSGGGGAAGGLGQQRVSGSRYSVDLGITAFELDLFGRIRSLTGAALDRYLATEAAARATRLTLTGDVADVWLAYAYDRTLLDIAQGTAALAQRSVALTRARLEGGIAPRTDLRQAEQILATAQADVASQRTALAQDVNALRVLLGVEVDPAQLPGGIDTVGNAVAVLPAGVDSRVLLRRPDVVQAEYQLRAANAEIGAARAALFPVISLTGALGFASNALTSLFRGSSFNYSAGPDVGYSIFRAGAGRAGVAFTRAQRDAALAGYERAIQIAFRETADALSRQGTIADQLRANQLAVDAAADTARLTEARYRGGTDTFLASLDAQRTLYVAQQRRATTLAVAASNRVALYRALGGDQTPDTAAREAVRP